MTDARFLWRVSAAARQLRKLLEIQERGEWTSRTTEDLWYVEHRIKQMTDEVQRARFRAALPQEETRACGRS